MLKKKVRRIRTKVVRIMIDQNVNMVLIATGKILITDETLSIHTSLNQREKQKERQ